MIVGIDMEKNGDQIILRLNTHLKISLVEKNQLKCIDNTIITL